MAQAKKLSNQETVKKGQPSKRSTRRKSPVRARTIPIKKMTKEQLRIGRLIYPETDHRRPKVRSECENGERPCPFVSCKYHLYLDVNPETGSIKLNFPDSEVWELEETCALDVAMRGLNGIETLSEIKRLKPLTEVIMLTGQATVESAIEGMKLGAYDFLLKPTQTEELLKKVDLAYERKAEQEERIRQAKVNDIVSSPRSVLKQS